MPKWSKRNDKQYYIYALLTAISVIIFAAIVHFIGII